MSAPASSSTLSSGQPLFITRKKLDRKANEMDSAGVKKAEFLQELKAHNNVLVVLQNELSGEEEKLIETKISKLLTEMKESNGNDTIATVDPENLSMESEKYLEFHQAGFVGQDTMHPNEPLAADGYRIGYKDRSSKQIFTSHVAVRRHRSADKFIAPELPQRGEVQGSSATAALNTAKQPKVVRFVEENEQLERQDCAIAEMHTPEGQHDTSSMSGGRKSILECPWVLTDQKDPVPAAGVDYPNPPGWLTDGEHPNLRLAEVHPRKRIACAEGSGPNKSPLRPRANDCGTSKPASEKVFRRPQWSAEPGPSSRARKRSFAETRDHEAAESLPEEQMKRAKKSNKPSSSSVGTQEKFEIKDENAEEIVGDFAGGNLLSIIGRRRKRQGPGVRWLFLIQADSKFSAPWWLPQSELTRIYGQLAVALIHRFNEQFSRETQPDVLNVLVSPFKPIPPIGFPATTAADENANARLQKGPVSRSTSTLAYIHGRRRKVQGTGYRWYLLLEYEGEQAEVLWQAELDLQGLYGKFTSNLIARVERKFPKARQEIDNVEYLYFDEPFKV